MKQIVSTFNKLDSGIETLFGRRKRMLGQFYAFLASLFTYINPLVVKLSGAPDTTTVMLIRGMTAFYVAYAVIQTWERPRLQIPQKIIYKLIIRGFLNIIGFYILYWSLKYINLQISLSIRQTAPMITYLLAVAIGQEKLTARRLLYVSGILVGMCLIINPNTIYLRFGEDSEQTKVPLYNWIVAALIFSGFIRAVVTVMMKTIKENDPMINVVYSSGTNLILCGLVYVFDEFSFECTLPQLFLFIMSGITSFGLQTYAFKAIKHEDASIVLVIMSLNVFYSFLGNVFWFHTIPELGAIIGSLVTLVFLALLSLHETERKVGKESQ